MEIYIKSAFGQGAISKDALAIRKAVFIDEQGINQADELDGQDEKSQHYVAYDQNDQPVATARVISENFDTTWHIQRVATIASARNQGIAKSILRSIERHAIDEKAQLLELNAQIDAQVFYKKLGYQTVGDVFLDAKIKHIKMQKKLNHQQEI